MRILLSLLLLVCAWAPPASAQGLPPGFVRSDVNGSFSLPVGVTFDANGRMYVWDRSGRVWIVENDTKLATPLVDIHEEVRDYQDHGMLGFALHPNFLQNGWIYLLYAVDHYPLLHANDPNYDPSLNDYNAPSIGRITRYTARASDGFHTVDPASRVVLLGEAPGTGCPILYTSHGVGSLVFGSDDTLLATCGDGASYQNPHDTGGPSSGAQTVQALAEGIIQPYEDVGALRAQLPNTLAGKLLRIDPRSGDGVASNPYFDAANPRSARSRVYALGFRNAFRFVRRPGTGSHLKSDGDPGRLYVGNVGWNTWEELEVVDRRAYNGGWPLYEGMDNVSAYQPPHNAPNYYAPNPLNGIGTCSQPYFFFRNLIVQATLGVPSWPNPCDGTQQIPAAIPRYVHDRPTLAYAHAPTGPMRTPGFNGSTPVGIDVGAAGSPVTGSPIGGFTITGMAWYTASDFPPAYRNSFYLTDYTSQWIARFSFDANDEPTALAPFATAAGGVTSLASSPTTGALYAVDLDASAVYRISYPGNQPPVARALAAPSTGASPVAVHFTGSTSTDPEGQPLSYLWSFGDGTPTSVLADPNHTFAAPVGVPTGYTVSLEVRDAQNQPATAQVVIGVNDTAPQVAITSPLDQGLYSMTGPSSVPLTAAISDAEHGPAQLGCSWQTTLHHNGQPEPARIAATCAASADLDPVGCDENSFRYAFALTVTDVVGVATTRTVTQYPDCASLLPPICGNLDGNAVRDAADVTRLRAALANPLGNGLSAGELARCSTIRDTACNVADLVVLRRYLQGRAPGPAPVCPAGV